MAGGHVLLLLLGGVLGHKVQRQMPAAPAPGPKLMDPTEPPPSFVKRGLAPAPAPMPMAPAATTLPPEPRLMPSLEDGKWVFVDGEDGVRLQSYANELWFYKERQAAAGAAPLKAAKRTAALEMLMPALTAGQWRYFNPDGSVKVQRSKPRPLAPGPAPAPAPAASACGALVKAADFVKCKEVQVLASESFSGVPQLDRPGQLLGCHCGVWAEQCPMQSCETSHAWEGLPCLAKEATELGFVAISHARQPLPDAEKSISLCMYWLPDPLPPPAEPVLAAPAPGMAPVPAPAPVRAAPAQVPAPIRMTKIPDHLRVGSPAAAPAR